MSSQTTTMTSTSTANPGIGAAKSGVCNQLMYLILGLGALAVALGAVGFILGHQYSKRTTDQNRVDYPSVRLNSHKQTRERLADPTTISESLTPNAAEPPATHMPSVNAANQMGVSQDMVTSNLTSLNSDHSRKVELPLPGPNLTPEKPTSNAGSAIFLSTKDIALSDDSVSNRTTKTGKSTRIKDKPTSNTKKLSLTADGLTSLTAKAKR